MQHTKEEIIKMINLDEPEYESIVNKLSNDDIPILIELSQHADPAIATKAISCLGLMNTHLALQGIQIAAENPNPIYRLAAAQALKNKPMSTESINILNILLDDEDLGVKKFAIKSVSLSPNIKLRKKLSGIAKKGTSEFIKTLAKEKLSMLDRNQ